MKKLIVYGLIIFAWLAMIVGAMGCNTERQALKHIHKAVRKDKPTVDKYFADNYNITDSTGTKVIYRQGETVTDTVTETAFELINDTVYLTKIKTVTVKQVDTIDRSTFERKQDGAKIAALNNQLTEARETIAKTEKQAALAEQEAKRTKKQNTYLSIGLALFIIIKIVMLWLKKSYPVSKGVGLLQKIF